MTEKQRGIAAGWLYLIGLIVLLSILSAIGAAIYRAGAQSERAKWEAREARINAEAATKIEAANKRVREAEQSIAAALTAASGKYQRDLKRKNDALNIALNSLRAGTGGLFVHTACSAASGGNPADSTAAGAGGRDGPPRAELSAADSEFLLRLGAEADAIVLQLTACQAVIRADRREPLAAAPPDRSR